MRMQNMEPIEKELREIYVVELGVVVWSRGVAGVPT
jgi:hypothetical protein